MQILQGQDLPTQGTQRPVGYFNTFHQGVEPSQGFLPPLHSSIHHRSVAMMAVSVAVCSRTPSQVY